MGYHLLQPRFFIGPIYRSKGVRRLRLEVKKPIWRHQCGDWGDINEEQKQFNERGILNGTAILSRFQVEAPDGSQHRLLILTENFRGRTVALLDHEFDQKIKRPPPGSPPA